MKRFCWLLATFLLAPLAPAQDIQKPEPAGTVRKGVLHIPLAIADQIGATGRDFAKFRDPQWSALTIAQIGAGTADAVTSLNYMRTCHNCVEIGPSRLFVGQHPDAHKFYIAGAIEITVEAVAAHYFRTHGPTRKWYWRALWSAPQSLSLYEHARAAQKNAALK
jgi:hypothetical protein